MNTNTAATAENPALDDVLAAGVRDVRAAFDYGNYADALNACEILLARRPGQAEALLLLGLISYELEEPQRALLLLVQAHETAPEIREYADALASVNALLGDVGEGLYYAKLAAILQPHWLGDALLPEKYCKFFEGLRNADPYQFRNRARRELEKGDTANALASCEKQLALTADDPETWRLLAQAAAAVGNIERVLDASEFLSAEDPLLAGDYDVLAAAFAKVGRFDDAEPAHLNAIESEPDDPALSQRRIRSLAARHGNTGGHLERENSAWAAKYMVATGVLPPCPPAVKDSTRPLRIAYVGGELHAGPLADLLTPILMCHDETQVQTYLYAANARYDTASENLARRCTRWTDISGVDPATVAQILRGDEIDISVDLCGHGPDSQLQMFAQRPAPICVSWLGDALPVGTGFDYQLSSELLAPAVDPTDKGATAIYRLPATHLAYRPLNAPETITPLPARQQPHITLGVMAPLAELDDGCVRDWSQIMDAIPNSRIVAANVERLKGAAVYRLHEMAAAHDILDRVDVADLEGVDPDGYGFFDHFDILLDPQPNSRFIETCRALWMGVPVLAIAGEGILGRQAAGALSAAQRPEWVFDNSQARIAGIADMVSDLGKLANLRASLRDELATTALFDVAGFARALEEAYRAM
jgi:tetratricopeptide (TPR) repeat protein